MKLNWLSKIIIRSQGYIFTSFCNKLLISVVPVSITKTIPTRRSIFCEVRVTIDSDIFV